MLQGTYLPSEVAQDLAHMQAHPALKAATQRLQALYAQVGARLLSGCWVHCRGQCIDGILARGWGWGWPPPATGGSGGSR